MTQFLLSHVLPRMPFSRCMLVCFPGIFPVPCAHSSEPGIASFAACHASLDKSQVRLSPMCSKLTRMRPFCKQFVYCVLRIPLSISHVQLDRTSLFIVPHTCANATPFSPCDCQTTLCLSPRCLILCVIPPVRGFGLLLLCRSARIHGWWCLQGDCPAHPASRVNFAYSSLRSDTCHDSSVFPLSALSK